MDEFNTLECSHLSPHHHCHFHQYQHLPPPPPLYQVGARSVQTASCPKHGQKQLADQEAPLEKIIKPISKVSAKTKQMDTKEILKILRERAICIVSCFIGLLCCLLGKPLQGRVHKKKVWKILMGAAHFPNFLNSFQITSRKKFFFSFAKIFAYTFPDKTALDNHYN